MKIKDLYNQKNKEELLERIQNEAFKRITCSFYKYVNIDDTHSLRDSLYIEWKSLKVLGRIYFSQVI